MKKKSRYVRDFLAIKKAVQPGKIVRPSGSGFAVTTLQEWGV